jgi:hypothetical protein
MFKNLKNIYYFFIFITLFSLTFPQNLTFSQTTRTYTKTDWSNPADFSSSLNINFGSELKIISISSSTTHTSYIDFQNGIFNTTTIENNGDIKLKTENEIGGWIQSASSAPWSGRYGHTSVVFDNKIWVIGGYNGNNLLNDIWYSSDGINWTLATNFAR